MSRQTKSTVTRSVLTKLSAMRSTMSAEEQKILDSLLVSFKSGDDVEAHAMQAKSVAAKSVATKSVATKSVATKSVASINIMFDSEAGEYKIID